MGSAGIGVGLRVALVSTPFVSVPPRDYGGTELVVGELAQALARRGIDVVVYATGDSDLPGVEVRAYFARALWPPNLRVDRTHAAWCLRDIARDPRGFDVVHVHTCAAVELARLCPYPMLATVHNDYDGELGHIYATSPQVKLVGISHSQARREKAPISAVVHHGLDPSRFLFLPDQGYLLFLGRYSRVKGAHTAIEVAERAGLPLILAGSPHERDYFEDVVRPMIEKHNVLEIGPVGGARKAALIARARATLFPIEWEEPFGLVMIESILSGVPVLANDRGSVREVIDDGVTGVVADDASELVRAARIADKLFDRRRIREIGRLRWSSDRMVADYLRLYLEVAHKRLASPSDEAAGA